MKTLYEIWDQFITGEPCRNTENHLEYRCTPGGVFVKDFNNRFSLMKPGEDISDPDNPVWETADKKPSKFKSE